MPQTGYKPRKYQNNQSISDMPNQRLEDEPQENALLDIAESLQTIASVANFFKVLITITLVLGGILLILCLGFSASH